MDETAIVWIAAVVASLIGFGSLFHFSWIARTWPRATGRVVDNCAEYSKGGDAGGVSVAYFPRIEFQAGGGTTHVVKGDVGRRKPAAIGEKIQLWYKPSNPQHAMTMKLPARLMFSGAFIAVGTACWLKIAGLVGN
ncbi:MAG: DUF3592 domain-containing protein [Pseudomonadota bacterium]